VISGKSPFLAYLAFLASRGIYKMSFLEMTKRHLSRQEDSTFVPDVRILDGHIVKKIAWKSEKAIIFQDLEGHFWRYLPDYRISERAVIRGKSN
jgi:hypothetical protein